ncbi:MAG TPA: D-alanyl-D-alanine carboxypeptidase/D-alanyl-D-alanine-endopeptidase, partial [Acidimicrobiales bacterium]|nr:D-alanyl-D-alanine carboxypeptidase/D-alanyl-D-alanine-endopeptidase [Acidimicrobiales bacterium]
MLPALLAVVVLGCGGAAVALSADDPAPAVGIDQVVATPVLSARRVPEVVSAPVADRRLASDLQSWLGASPPDACLVVATEGRDVFEHNPVLPVTGASTQKLLTATGLLLAYGPEHTFTTTASAAAAPRGGVVAGDLYLVGGGPSDLGTPDWPRSSPGTRQRVVHDIDGLVDAIAAAGVTRIEGSVVGDGTRFDDQRYEPTIASRLIEQDQVGPISGLMVNDGFGLFGPQRSNASTVPATDPAADAARVLTERLAARGIAVTGPPRSGAAPDDATPVATLDSPPVSQLVGEMLTTSDNEAAEAAIKEIGVATGDEGTWAAGAVGLTGLLQEAGVPVEGVRVVDGSGLSIEDRFTCATLVDVLTLEDTGPVVRAGLPVAGETGTLADRYEGTPLVGRLRAKTGTLRNVTALAGEIDPLQGGSLTFAYVANVPDPGEVTAGEVGVEQLGEILLGYPRGLDLAALQPLAA